MTHRVALFVYQGFELLDAAGPASVFNAANMLLRRDNRAEFYAVEIVSPSGGLVVSSSGVALQTTALAASMLDGLHTLLVTGALQDPLMAVLGEPEVRAWLPLRARQAGRLGSICSGTFILAGLGLVDGKRVATHWDASAPLARNFPLLSVDAESIYVEDGDTWTSAGVTTGIDMALAMVARDLDAALAARVAQWLVLYARRPGHQSQFSPMLRAQARADNPFADLIDWLHANLHLPLDVRSVADRAGLSERTFHRKFQAATGQSPARFIEGLRLDAARLLLTRGHTIKEIAVRVGLFPSARLTMAFERRFGMTPRLFREMHTMAEPGTPALPRQPQAQDHERGA